LTGRRGRLSLGLAVGLLALSGALPLARPQAVLANVPGTGCPVFPADNIWNADVSGLPLNSHSAAWLSSTGASSGRNLHPDFGGPPYGIPFNVVHSSHATTNFTFQYANESDPGPYPYGGDLAIEQGSDAHLLSIDQDTCKLYETFATNSNGPRTAGSGAIFDLSTNALRPAGWTSADAAGLPIFPGLLRLDEGQSGYVGHAVRFTVAQSDSSYLWPARHQASALSDPNLPPMGARFRLKAGFDISSFGPEAQVVLTAFKHYGLIVADNGSNWFFTGTSDAGWDVEPYATMVSQLKRVPASAFEAIDESGLMHDPNSAQAGTIPAAPAAPHALALWTSAAVSWAPPANGGEPILSYTVNGSPGGQVVVGGGATSATVTGLTTGVSYIFKVTATNVVGPGPASPPSNAVVPGGRLPVLPNPTASPPVRTPIQQSTPASQPPSRPVQAKPSRQSRAAPPHSAGQAPAGVPHLWRPDPRFRYE